MDSIRYTLFPDLRGHTASSADFKTVQHSCAIDAVCPSQEDLIRAWAAVLHAFTRDEQIVFAVDDATVKVTIAEGTLTLVQPDGNATKHGCRTGIFTKAGDYPGFPLQLRVSATSGVRLVASPEAVPSDFLPQIGKELAVRIDQGSIHSEEEFTRHGGNQGHLSISNPDPRVMEGPKFLHHVFERYATEERCAVEYLDARGIRSSFSYKDIEQISQGLASRIRKSLGRDSSVDGANTKITPILIPQSPALYIAILAVLRTGAAFCPLDPDAPPERIQFILKDLAATLVLTDEAFTERFSWDGGPEVIVVDADLERYRQCSARIPSEPEHSPNGLAYVMYTSGSTGTPKGVGVSHLAVTQSLLAHDIHIPCFTRFLQFAAPTFDVFVFELFFPLFRGSTLVACNRRDLLNDLPKIINDMDVDGAVMTPTVVGGLLRKREQVPRLKVLMTIGEMLTRPVIDEFGDGLGREGILYAMYGPTEAAIHCTVAPKLHGQSKVGIIGRPFDTVSAFILPPRSQGISASTELEVLPVGHIGELALGGYQLASGYLNRPEQTREVFIETQTHGRLYRTGDKARLLPDGTLECLGRLGSDQVKVRGQRLELGEVEQVVSNMPAIRTALASAVDGNLVVFCIPDNPSVSVDSVAEACRRWLPAPLVPGDIILLEELPRLPSGKADRKSLDSSYRHIMQARINGSGRESAIEERTGSAGWSMEERIICEILSDLSGVEKIQINRKTSIFQLGLDSICAVQVASALREQGWNVSAVDVLQQPSVDQLALFLVKTKLGNARRTATFDFVAFDRRHRSIVASGLQIPESQLLSIRPCTAEQSGMLASFINSDGSKYLIHIVLRLDSDVVLAKLQEAWKIVAVKYSMLRTGFTALQDHQHPFVMVEYKPSAREIPCHDTEPSHSLRNAIEKHRKLAQQSILEGMHEPPWRLSVFVNNSSTFIQISALHALFDAQTIQLILKDVARAYKGQIQAAESPIEPVLGAILSSSVRDMPSNMEFWQSTGRVMPASKFPNMSPLRVDGGNLLVSARPCSWTQSRLEKTCNHHGVTLSVAGQAAWSRVLSAYLGQDTITFGLVLSARTLLEGSENTAFPCVTALPLSCAIQSTNIDLLRKLMELNLNMRSHQFASLQQVQQWTGHGNETPFDTLFAYQKFEANNTGMHLPWKIVDEVVVVNCPISIELQPLQGEDRLLLQITHQEEILPQRQAELLLDQLDFALVHTISNAESQCNDYSAFEPSLLSISPAKEPELFSDSCLLHNFVDKYAHMTPHRVAFEFATRSGPNGIIKRQWTFLELSTEANKIAHLILNMGLLPGDLVAHCFEKCPEASIAILGILKAGCCYVALDPHSPSARRSFILEDSGAKILLTSTGQAAMFQENIELPIVELDRRGVIEGTTGVPKGCDITHENAVQAILAFQRVFSGRWDNNSRWLQFASYHFDVSVLEHFWSWSVGICVTSAPRDMILEDLPGIIRQCGITHIDLTPSLARTLNPSDTPSLWEGVFITGGELLKQEILDAWGPKACIYNAYGPTEATIGVTAFPRVPINGKPSNLGFQFDNVGIYVFCPGSSSPVIRGAVGELCVSGKLVGRGYRNRSDLTKERFQYLENFGGRVYRTGDLVRLLHDGTLDFVGRRDDQVKIRGQRLEVTEINEVIKKDVSKVAEVTTLVIKHPQQEKEQLVCFVTLSHDTRRSPPAILQPDSEVSAVISKIRSACRARLPSYGIPTHIIPLSSIPLSPNNKVDVTRLKDIYSSLTLSDRQKLTSTITNEDISWSSMERQAVTVMADFLRVEIRHIRKDSNIFELGLDSISVTGLARLLKEKGFSNSRPSLILKNLVIGNLVKALQNPQDARATLPASQLAAKRKVSVFQQRHSFTACRALEIQLESVECIAPCTPLQEGMIVTALKTEGTLYSNSFYFELSSQTNLKQLEKAWQNVIRNCQILRASFCMTEDGFAQVFKKPRELTWDLLSAASDNELTVIKHNRYSGWRQQNMHSITKPFEVFVIRGPSATIMCVHIFHALYDGSSFELLLRRLRQEYEEEANINYGPSFQDVLPVGPLCELPGAREYWMHRMRGAPSAHMPSLTGSDSLEAFEAELEMENMSGFEETRRKLNTTHQSVIQACWMSVLKQYYENGVTVGVVVSGRSIDVEGIDETIGPLFNTLPYFLQLQPTDTWMAIVKKCHAFGVDSLPYQHVPLRDIMKWCSRSMDQPFFDTLFVFDKELENPYTGPQMWTLVESKSRADYPLSFEARLQVNGHLKVKIIAQEKISNHATSTMLLKQFAVKLRDLIEGPDNTYDSFSAKDHLTLPWNDEVTELHSLSLSRTNGLQPEFEWTEKASQIRKELASLACIAVTDISEDMTISQIGLDSIDAVKLVSRLRRQGIVLEISTIMRSPTIANMVQHLSDESDTDVSGSSLVKLEEYERILRKHLNTEYADLDDFENILPATPLQEAMIAIMMKTQQATYFNHDIMKLATNVDVKRLMDAWDTVIAQTPILRTSFIEIDHPEIPLTFVQVVRRPRPITWHTTELSEDDNILDAVNRGREESLSDLQSQPPFNLKVYKKKEDVYIVLSIAHMLYDGWSLGLLHDDVRRVYEGLNVSRPTYRPVLERILQSSGPSAEDFWRIQLSGVESTTFPRRDTPSPPGSSRLIYGEKIATVSAELVQAFCKNRNITTQALGQTCWSFILAHYSRKLEVVFGAVFSGRDTEEASEVLFPTMNTVAVRSVLHGTRGAMLRYMLDINAHIGQFQHYPLRNAQKLAKYQDQELFNTLFIVQKRPPSCLDKRVPLYQSIGGTSRTEYALCTEMEFVDNNVVWRATCEESVMDRYHLDHMFDQIDSVFQSIMNDPDAPSFEVTDHGTSICGLPPIHISDGLGLRESSISVLQETSQPESEWTEMEKSIRRVLSLVSKVPEFEIHKDETIFHLGLDSISAIKVASLLRKESIKLSVSELLAAATIARIALLASRSPSMSEESIISPETILADKMNGLEIESICASAGVDIQTLESVLPASPGQLYFMSIWQNTRGAVFHSTFDYKCREILDKERLENAWRSLLVQCPVLRSTLVATGQRSLPLLQVVLKDGMPTVWSENSMSLNEVQRSMGFDLPTLHIDIRRSSQETLLHLQLFHTHYDAISLSSLISHLQSLYHNSHAQIQPRPRFDDFLALSFSQSQVSKREEFWKKYLKSSSGQLVEFTHATNGVLDNRTEVYLPALLPTITKLERSARSHGLSLHALFLAAYARSLAAFWSKHGHMVDTADVVLGVYLANRSHPLEGLPTLAIPTVNIVPLRVNIASSKTLPDVASRIQEDLQVISSPTNVQVSLWEIDNWTGIKIHSTVNFLKLPDLEGPPDEPNSTSGELIQFHPVEPEWKQGCRRTVGSQTDAYVEPPALKENSIRASYLPSIDVEAGIRDGALDVGIFGLTDLISLEDADGLLEGIKNELLAVDHA